MRKKHSTSASQQSSKKITKKPCIFCAEDSHDSNRCLKISEPSARKLFVKKNKLCFLCLKTRTSVKPYSFAYFCHKCKGNHNVTNWHYLPPFPVVRENQSTTKIRIGFHVSAKRYDEKFLHYIMNKHLCLLPYFFDIFFTFCIGKPGLIGEIRQEFFQICIRKNDKNYLRLLWFDNVNDQTPKIKIICFNCLVFVLLSSPFILYGIVNLHLEKYSPFICRRYDHRL